MKLWQKITAGVGGALAVGAAVVGGPVLGRAVGGVLQKVTGGGKKGQPGQTINSMASQGLLPAQQQARTGATYTQTGQRRRKASKRIVISENTIKGISMILAVGKGRRVSFPRSGRRRKRASW